MSFNTLGLSAELLRAVADSGYTTPTPIQQETIPVIVAGRDCLAGAQTGTGKTAGFTLPLLHRMQATTVKEKHRPIRALILVPTRELAAQVQDSVRAYSKYLPFRSLAIYGGASMHTQIDKLRQGVDILVATPGRLLDHVRQKTLRLSQVEFLVLDEADRMLDMGFIADIRQIMGLLSKERQTLLFSATLTREIKALANDLLASPAIIELAKQNIAADTVKQKVYRVDRSRKRELLSYLIGANNWQQVLVFSKTKHGADRLAIQLEKDGLSATAIHGDKRQSARERALRVFKAGTIRVLVATDVAARGLDIDQLPHVVNFDLPHSPEDYVHRIGRTGRAGHEGEAISLVSVDEEGFLED
ncbi:MAG TPA: DEAD/DEAH box helicase, partial [Coxiellaceae bacterium]|nr:DEAD/DEAH box helicase [Coxiellaceae bacterium]